MAGALVPAPGATQEVQLILPANWPVEAPSEEDVAAEAKRPHSLSQAWHPLRCGVLNIYHAKTTSQLRVIELQRDYYSLLKLDFSSWKHIFLIGQRGWGEVQITLKSGGKFWLEQDTKMCLVVADASVVIL